LNYKSLPKQGKIELTPLREDLFDFLGDRIYGKTNIYEGVLNLPYNFYDYGE